MIIALRTDKPVSEVYLIDSKSNETIASKQWEAHRQLADTIHEVISDLMNKSHTTHAQISAVIVFKGPGSFTGLRIGISVANAIAYALNIPIVGTLDENWMNDGISKILNNVNDKIVTPEYGGKVNITTPKK